MRSLKLKTFLALYGIILLSGIVQSCCHEDLRITSQGRMNAWEIVHSENGIGRTEVSTIKGDFILSVIFNDELVMFNNLSLISSCNALSCSETWVNAIDSNALSISVNKEFMLNGAPVPANKNLLKLSNSGIILHNLAIGSVEFRFTDWFFSNAAIEDGEYIFTFNGRTNDNLVLTTNKTLAIDL